MIVLDASALLALLFVEEGHEHVRDALREAAMSTVNLAEVLSRVARDGHDPAALARQLAATPVRFLPFDSAAALQAGRLAPLVRHAGLSLGDRACLALAALTGAPALTADRAWARVDVGVEVRLIR